MPSPTRSPGGRVPGPLGLPGGDAEPSDFDRLPVDLGTKARTRAAAPPGLALAGPAGGGGIQEVPVTPKLTEQEALLLIPPEGADPDDKWHRTVHATLAAAAKAGVSTRAGLALFLATAEHVDQLHKDLELGEHGSGGGGGGKGGAKVVASKAHNNVISVVHGDGIHNLDAGQGGFRIEEGATHDETTIRLREAFDVAVNIFDSNSLNLIQDAGEAEQAFAATVRTVETAPRGSAGGRMVEHDAKPRLQRSQDAVNRLRYFRWVLGVERPAGYTENYSAL